MYISVFWEMKLTPVSVLLVPSTAWRERFAQLQGRNQQLVT